MSFDLKAAKNGLVALLQGTPGLQAVYNGAPESMPVQAAAWVSLGALPERPIAAASSGLYQLSANLLVTIGFVLEGNESVGEDAICDAVTEIIDRVFLNRVQTVSGVLPMLNGTVKDMEPPGPATGAADYVIIAGSEARVYPLAVLIYQRATIT